ncbi:MAG: HIT domain-containing protein [Caldithrix sp.]|nr:HIT domain-containing protein [Caldithrix sp.]
MEQLWAPWRMEYILSNAEKTEGCIFCEFPRQNEDEKNLIAYRSEQCFVILNRFPYNNGHIMVVPYQHTGDYTQLKSDVLMDMQAVIQKAIDAIHQTMHPHGLNIGMNLGRVAGAGIEDHVHYHIVPRWNGDTNYMPVLTGTKVVSEALQDTWTKLNKVMNK